jgi:HlyD family secretion protein
MLAAGGAVVELVDLNHLYLKVYVPENQIGKIRLGLPAQISTDAFPQHPFAATVSHIAARAEFTPRKCKPRMSG